jgi:hypothetical protein
MMRWTLLLTAVLIAATQPARADRGPERCYLVAEGGEAAFLAFDTELRSALSSADASTLALLVDFPLRVNFGDGTTISLNNPMAVQQRFQEVFPDALRAAVIKRKPEDLFCRDDGIMYGSGELWIHLVGQGEARHFAVATVNVPAGDRKVTAPATPVLFVCNADKHRIIVDMSSDGGVRYRSWNKPRSLADKADIVVAGGSADIE